MCERVVEYESYNLKFVPDYLKIQSMCERAVENEPYNLKFFPDHFKTQKICDKAVRDDSSSLQYVPDWFVTREGVDMWHDDYYDDEEDNFFKWYEGYKRRKDQKASIKEELLQNKWLLWSDLCIVCPWNYQKKFSKMY